MKKNNTNFKNLSAYTIEKNCSDFSDIKEGENEILQYIENCKKAGKIPVDSAYIRLYKLRQKAKKMSEKKKTK